MASWEIEQVGTRYVVLVDDLPHGVADSVEDARAEAYRQMQSRRDERRAESAVGRE